MQPEPTHRSIRRVFSFPFTFTATVAHATTLSLKAPSLGHRGSLVTVTGQVRSPAGTPQGTCLFPKGAVVALTSTGTCSGRVKLGHRRHQRIVARFVPSDGWQAVRTTRPILVIK